MGEEENNKKKSQKNRELESVINDCKNMQKDK